MILFDNIVFKFALSRQPPKVGQGPRPEGPVDPTFILVPCDTASTSTEHPELNSFSLCQLFSIRHNGPNLDKEISLTDNGYPLMWMCFSALVFLLCCLYSKTTNFSKQNEFIYSCLSKRIQKKRGEEPLSINSECSTFRKIERERDIFFAKLSRGEIWLANFIPPANGPSLGI